MVLLGRVFALLRRRRTFDVLPFSESDIVRGPDSVKDILRYTVMNIKKSKIREPAPGFKRTYKSIIFGRSLRMRVTLGTQRAIENAGGFDRFIFYTPEEKLKSNLARTLQRRMKELVDKYPSIQPPPLDKRKPKPLPKKLSVDISPVEVCDMTKYVYLG